MPAVSMAQQYYDPGILQKTIDRKPVEFEAPGARLGSFALHTGAELAFENNDNIYYLNNFEISDNIMHVRPWLSLNSDWNRHMLNFSFYADIARYEEFGTEDYEDWVISLDGRIDVKRGSAFSYTASYMQLHEDRSNPDNRGGITPTEFTLGGFDLGYSHTFNRLTAMLGYSTADTDYDNNVRLDGSILDNQDRDRSRDMITLRADYAYSEKSSLFFSYGENSVDYDQQIDHNGQQRSSSGSDFRGGLSWDMTGVLTGDLYVSYIEQDYDDPALRSLDNVGIGADLEWTPTELTIISINFANTAQETTQASTSGYVSNLYSARVQHELRRNVLFNLRFSYTDNQYEFNGPNAGNLNNTQVTRGGIGLSYLFNRRAYVSGGYIYESQNANDPLFEYKTNRLFVTFGLEL